MDFLVGSYEPAFFWWELAEYLRKFLLTGALVFAEQASVSLCFLGLLISFFYYAAVTDKGPYREDESDRLKMVSEMQHFVTLLCILCLMPNVSLTGEALDRGTIDIIKIGTNAVAMPVVLLLTIRHSASKKPCESGEEELRRRLSGAAATFASAETSIEMVEKGEMDNPLAEAGQAASDDAAFDDETST